MERNKSDIAETIKRHRQRWQEVGGGNLLQRVHEPGRDRKELSVTGTKVQDGEIVSSLVEHLPQDMHHFRALLDQLARELKTESENLR